MFLFNKKDNQPKDYTQLEVVAIHEAAHYWLGKANEEEGDIFIQQNPKTGRWGGCCLGCDGSTNGALAGLAAELEIVGYKAEKDCCYNSDIRGYLGECGGSERRFNRDLAKARKAVRRNRKKILDLANEILQPENFNSETNTYGW